MTPSEIKETEAVLITQEKKLAGFIRVQRELGKDALEFVENVIKLFPFKELY